MITVIFLLPSPNLSINVVILQTCHFPWRVRRCHIWKEIKVYSSFVSCCAKRLIIVFVYTERESHSEVREECPVGVRRGCTRLRVGTYDMCSLPQVGSCSSRTVCTSMCDIKAVCFVSIYFLTYVLTFLSRCVVCFGAGSKSEVSQPQPKLYTRPFEAARADIHPTCFTGASRRGK